MFTLEPLLLTSACVAMTTCLPGVSEHACMCVCVCVRGCARVCVCVCIQGLYLMVVVVGGWAHMWANTQHAHRKAGRSTHTQTQTEMEKNSSLILSQTHTSTAAQKNNT